MAAREDGSGSKALNLVFALVKLACVVVGFPLTVFCLAAVSGAFIESGWIQLIVAVAVAIVLPLVMVVWIVPDGGDAIKSRSLAGTLFAVILLILPTYFLIADHSAMFTKRGERLSKAEYPRLSQLAYWLAGTTPAVMPGKDDTPPDKSLQPRERTSQRPGVVLVGRDKADTKKTKPATTAKKVFTPAELFAKWSKSVVAIKAVGSGSGTGFFVDDKGTVATNHHVIHGATKLRVRTKDGTWHEKVEVLAKDSTSDLAILSTSPTKPTPSMVLGDSQAVVVGQRVVAIGNPLGLDFSLTDGLVSQRRLLRGRKWLQISVPISPGNSGGPLIDQHGEVIGVNTAGLRAREAQNINLAVPINQLKTMIKNHRTKPKKPGSEASKTW